METHKSPRRGTKETKALTVHDVDGTKSCCKSSRKQSGQLARGGREGN